MGHTVEYYSFKTSERKDIIQAEMDDVARREGNYHNGLGAIDFRDNKCFDTFDEALEYIKGLGGFYLQVAVKYKKVSFKPSAKLTTLRERMAKARNKYYTLNNKFHFADHKSEAVGCKHCGSKIVLKYLHSNHCPVCRTDMRPETIQNRIAALKAKKEKLRKQVYKLYLAEQKKPLKKTEEMWLVKIEYHV